MEDTSMAESPSEVLQDRHAIEMTLAIIKPEATKFAAHIENIIIDNGFDILSKRTLRMTPEQVAEFYGEHIEQTYFPNLVIHMANNPIIAMCIAKPNAIAEWLQLIGPANVLEARAYWPTSLRASYGLDTPVEEEGAYSNAVHGSKHQADAVREIHFFFPTMVVEPILKGAQVTEYLQGHVNPTLLAGLEQLCSEQPEDPVVWLADWLLTHNPNTPEIIQPDTKGAEFKANVLEAEDFSLTSIRESTQS